VAGAGRAHRSNTGAKIPITCTAHGVAATRECVVTITMSVRHRAKLVTVGRATVAVRTGLRRIVAISLNGEGNHLLAARGNLAASIAVAQTVSGHSIVVSHQRLTL
jgi:hypothetical protein